MKVKLYNNEIVDIIQVGTSTHLFDIKDVEIIQDDPDYWTRLEHQCAGMAMQGILSNQNIGADVAYMVNLSTEIAHALVEKLKEERK